ncbi:hypothetical protein GW835_02335 [archaeon]|nr:hypothetical protein [archaeon]NCP79385.1 hypothetical protein [archaeon]NCP97328.1 hypothetical protein [archaeon]NCQ07152.1 hypothetical protein [archaeon]NCQ50948.1 hypothetical protein [archaeon]
MIKNITLLGSNNDIGIKTIEFLKNNTNKFKIYSLSYDSKVDNLDFFISQIKDVSPKKVFIPLEKDAEYIESKTKVEIITGTENFPEFIKSNEIDQVISSLSGLSSVKKILSTIYEFKDITLLNTSPFLYCGRIITNEVKSKGVNFNIFSYPVYSLDFILKSSNINFIKNINLFTKQKNKKEKITINDYKDFGSYLKAYYSENNIRLVNDMFIIYYLYNIPIDNFNFYEQSERIINIEIKFLNGTSVFFKANLDIDSIFNYYFLDNEKIVENKEKDLDKISFSYKKIDPTKEKFLSLGIETLKKGGSFPIIYYITIETLLYYIYKRKIKENIDIYKIVKEFLEDKTLYDKFPDLSSVYAIDNKINEKIKNKFNIKN